MTASGWSRIELERAVFDTIRYFDLFEMPVTVVQVWRSLIIDRVGSGVRWHGHQVPALVDIREVLAESRWLQRHVVGYWGYFMLRSSVAAEEQARQRVRKRLMRHAEAQHKWKLLRRAMRVMGAVPLVRGLFASGSLALFNTRRSSDLDVLVIARRGRIWTVRLLLLFVTQLLGRRRKHWDEVAPDKVCLNHYVTDEELAMPVAVRSVYGAVLYSHLVPLVGLPIYEEWVAANETWWKRWLMYPAVPQIPSRLYVRVNSVMAMLKRFLEGVLREVLGDMVERWAERWQRQAIARHTEPGRAGRISVSANELAFHPATKVPAILAQFEQDEGQQVLL